MSTTIVTHMDVDGVLAASVLLAGLRTEWAAEPVRFSTYQQLDSTLQAVLASANVDELYLTDMDVTEIQPTTFSDLLSKTRFNLVDHHSLDASLKRMIEATGGRCWHAKPGQETCSTELAIRAVGQPATDRLAFLGAAARADDFNDPDVPEEAQRFAHDLGAALMPGSELPPDSVVQALVGEIERTLQSRSNTAFTLPEKVERRLRRAANAVRTKQVEARDRLEIDSSKVSSTTFGDIRVACARVPDVLLGKPGVEVILAKRPEDDVAAAFFDDGACWVFPRDFPRGRLDLLPFLQALGGGGRDGAGGFGFQDGTTEENYRGRLDWFVTAVRTFGNDAEFQSTLRTLPGGLRRSAT